MTLAKMTFVQDDGQGIYSQTEKMWVSDLGDQKYRLDNTPFDIHGVSYKDVVLGKRFGDTLFFIEVLERGGHSTIQIEVVDTAYRTTFLDYGDELMDLGCEFEINDMDETKILAMDIPPEAPLSEILQLLEHGQSQGIFTYEKAHIYEPSNN